MERVKAATMRVILLAGLGCGLLALACGGERVIPTGPTTVPPPSSPPASSPPPSSPPSTPPGPRVELTTYEVTGVVTDDNGKPIASAAVYLYDSSGPSGHADPSGRYSIRFTSFPGRDYYLGWDPPSAADAVAIATIDAPGHDPYSAFVSAPAAQFSRDFRLHRQRRIAVGEAAVIDIVPDDSMCIVDVWPGRDLICRRIYIIPASDGILTVTAAPADGGEPPRFFEAWRRDGGGFIPGPESVRVVAGSEVIVQVGVPWGQVAPRSFLITSALSP